MDSPEKEEERGLLSYPPLEFSKAQKECPSVSELLGKVRKGNPKFKKFRENIMKLCHDSWACHLGITKTKDRLARHYYWPNCYREIEEYVKCCDPCQ